MCRGMAIYVSIRLSLFMQFLMRISVFLEDDSLISMELKDLMKILIDISEFIEDRDDIMIVRREGLINDLRYLFISDEIVRFIDVIDLFVYILIYLMICVISVSDMMLFPRE